MGDDLSNLMVNFVSIGMDCNGIVNSTDNGTTILNPPLTVKITTSLEEVINAQYNTINQSVAFNYTGNQTEITTYDPSEPIFIFANDQYALHPFFSSALTL